MKRREGGGRTGPARDPERPPILAELAFRLLCPGRYRDQELGDLREAYALRLARGGRRSARRLDSARSHVCDFVSVFVLERCGG